MHALHAGMILVGPKFVGVLNDMLTLDVSLCRQLLVDATDKLEFERLWWYLRLTDLL